MKIPGQFSVEINMRYTVYQHGKTVNYKTIGIWAVMVLALGEPPRVYRRLICSNIRRPY